MPCKLRYLLTANVYGHPTDRMRQRVAERMEAILGRLKVVRRVVRVKRVALRPAPEGPFRAQIEW
jgi:hypothetical protein